VLATSLLEYFWRVNKSEWKKIPRLFPENIAGAGLIVILSLLPLFGISWWILLGIKSQIVGIFMVFGILIIVTGVWGHIRLLRILPAREAKSDANTL
jgi:protein-S-isoprenylcysteine O-methyltransferase Ste14